MRAKKIWEYLLDLMLPRPESVKSIEEMGPEEFRRATRVIRDATPDTLAVFDYKHPLIRQAIWELKYRGNRKITELLAKCVFEELVDELSSQKIIKNFDTPLLIPIPLSKKRLRERGFNQCELVAEILGKLDNGNFFEVRTNLLIKIKDTESQTKKNRGKRLENLKGCFVITKPENITDRNVIVLDDVTTTGATFDEARRTLEASGARRVLFTAIAR